MEKTISPEERIRRAEEIYYRRKLNNNSVRMPSSQVKQGRENRQFSLYKKMILQILICIFIYLIFSLIKETNYIFSEAVINKTKEFLSTDINFTQISNQVGNFFRNNQDKFNFVTKLWNKEENKENEENANLEEQNNQNKEENNEENNTTNEQTNSPNSESNNENEENSSENVGIGGNSKDEQIVQASAEGISNKKNQMEIDAEYIKKNFSMVLPAKAKITSPYGKREPTEIISENHQGIDIGVVVGTTIISAMEGTVSVVSDVGDYGKHVKVVNKDVTTIYAHCSKILVKEGQKVKKGQKIALSGNTGNTTGPHLHFEIRREERAVDPELILSWT